MDDYGVNKWIKGAYDKVGIWTDRLMLYISNKKEITRLIIFGTWTFIGITSISLSNKSTVVGVLMMFYMAWAVAKDHKFESKDTEG
jgi:hypothetical protein